MDGIAGGGGSICGTWMGLQRVEVRVVHGGVDGKWSRAVQWKSCRGRNRVVLTIY
jgi:hypothetical protein